MTTIAIFPLMLLVLLAVGVVALLSKLGRRGVLVLIGGLVVLMVLLVGIGLLRARVVSRTEALSVITHQTALEQARREAAAIRDSVERQRDELRQTIDRQRAALRVSTSRPADLMVEVPALLDPLLPAVEKEWQPLPAEPWKSVAELGFEADMHPSTGAAAEAIIVQLLKLKDASYPDVAIERVQVWAGEGIDSADLSKAVACLQRKRPDWQVMAEGVEPLQPLRNSDPKAASMRLEIVAPGVRHPAPWDQNRPQHYGTLRVQFRWEGGSLDRSTPFVEKPWVDNTSQFITAAPQMRWVVGYSSPDSADIVTARRESARSVAFQLLPDVRANAKRYFGSGFGLDDRWLQSRIEDELTRGTGMQDTFVQTLITPSGGQVCRQAILVRGPVLAQRVAAELGAYLRGRNQSWFAVGASGAAMLLLVCVVGLLLNSLTKGYYRGRIVAVAGFALILGGMVLVKFLLSAHAGAPPIHTVTAPGPVVRPMPADSGANVRQTGYDVIGY